MRPADLLGFSPKHEVFNDAMGNVVVRVTPTQWVGGEPSDVVLTPKQYDGYLEWKIGGVSIQRAMYDVSPDVREILMTGLTPATFPKGDD